MYYLKIRDSEEGSNSLIYYCRNCGNEDTTLTSENICVSETQLRRSEQKFTHMVNEYTKFDPTLPRINTIKCPNQACISNGGNGQKGEEEPQDLEQNAGGRKKTVVEGEGAAAETGTEKKKKPILKVKTKKVEQAVEPSPLPEKAPSPLAEKAPSPLPEAGLKLAERAGQSPLREVIYIRYDDINMKYVYLCVHCDTTWKTDNRM
jgi:hypothetical protein